MIVATETGSQWRGLNGRALGSGHLEPREEQYLRLLPPRCSACFFLGCLWVGNVSDQLCRSDLKYLVERWVVFSCFSFPPVSPWHPAPPLLHHAGWSSTNSSSSSSWLGGGGVFFYGGTTITIFSDAFMIWHKAGIIDLRLIWSWKLSQIQENP